MNRVFKFGVNPDRTFHFDEPEWAYGGKDHLRFETNAGPFSLDLKRTDAEDDPLHPMRPFPLLHSTPQGPPFVAETDITDGLTDKQRADLAQAHVGGGNPEGFIARYRYLIDVTLPDGNILHNEQQDGDYTC